MPKKNACFRFNRLLTQLYTKAFFLPARGGELLSTPFIADPKWILERRYCCIYMYYCTLVYISAYERGAEGESCSAVCRKASFPSQTKKVLLAQARWNAFKEQSPFMMLLIYQETGSLYCRWKSIKWILIFKNLDEKKLYKTNVPTWYYPKTHCTIRTSPNLYFKLNNYIYFKKIIFVLLAQSRLSSLENIVMANQQCNTKLLLLRGFEH